MPKTEVQAQIWAGVKCGECAFYHPIINAQREYVNQGICKRYPPTPIKVADIDVIPLVASPIGQQQKGKQAQINSYQPIVAHNWPGCGEAVPMPKHQGAEVEDIDPPEFLVPDDKGGAKA